MTDINTSNQLLTDLCFQYNNGENSNDAYENLLLDYCDMSPVASHLLGYLSTITINENNKHVIFPFILTVLRTYTYQC